MAKQGDRGDQQIDRNLRRIAEHLDLPDVPASLTNWKPGRAACAAPVQHKKGNWIMRHARFLTAAGSAVAAMIAIAMFIVLAPSSRVEAATILKSFRSTLLDGFQLSLTNIEEDGIHVDGQMVLVFQPGAATDPDRKLESLYVDAHIQADETNEDIPGVDMSTTVSFSEPSQWVYLKLNQVSDKLLEDEPVLDALSVYAEQGLFLRVDGIWEKLQGHLTNSTIHQLFGEAHDHALDKHNITISIGHESTEGEKGVNVAVQANAAADADAIEASLPEMHELARSLLLGTAGADEIEALMTFVEHAAKDVQVVEREPGLHVLTIRDFNVEGEDAEAAELTANLELAMAYREGQGIEWAEVRHIGASDGMVRINPADRAALAELSDMNRVIEPGTTTVLDLSSLMPLIESALEAHHP